MCHWKVTGKFIFLNCTLFENHSRVQGGCATQQQGEEVHSRIETSGTMHIYEWLVGVS